MPDESNHSLLTRLDWLNRLGIALAAETNLDRLLEQILVAAKTLTGADGGTLYKLDQQQLVYAVIRNDTLGLYYNPAQAAGEFPPLPLYDANGKANARMIAAWACLSGQTINIEDIYDEAYFDVSGPKRFDTEMHYRSKSLLTVPLKCHDGEALGILQLINRKDEEGATVPFSRVDVQLAHSLASQAAVALKNRQLLVQHESLLMSFIKIINYAIDSKSPYTSGHCQRVPELTMLLADAAHQTTEGPLAGFSMSETDRQTLHIAGLLHDCGKITTPAHVIDKSTKLQTVVDRITLIEHRFEILRRDTLLALYRAGGGEAAVQAEYRQIGEELDAELEFLRTANIGGEFLPPEAQERVRSIARRTWLDAHGVTRPLITEEELENLLISRGTLNAAERKIVNGHIDLTIHMLEALPWPRHLAKVPEYAGGHHERMDGKGYPRGLKGTEMSVPARVMAIADIFEALTAKDRPYKAAKTLSESLALLGRMSQTGHIDPDLFDVFVRRQVYLVYAEKFLDPAQIDLVDLTRIPGYTP